MRFGFFCLFSHPPPRLSPLTSKKLNMLHIKAAPFRETVFLTDLAEIMGQGERSKKK